MKNSPNTIQRLTLTMAWSLSSLIALLAPAGYFLISYEYLRGELEAHAELRSHDISDIIHKNPVMWRFEEIRISELLEPAASSDDKADFMQVVDDRGELLAKNHIPRTFPHISYRHDVYDMGAVVAHIEISRSLTPLLYRTLFISFFSMIIAYLVFTVLRTLPLRAIQNAFQALQESEDKYRALFNTMKEGLSLHRFTRDADGIRTSLSLIDANPSCIALLGRDRQQIIGSDSLALFGEVFRRHFQELARVEEHRGHTSFELTMPDDKYYIVHAFSPERDHVATLFEDITTRKRAESERLNMERKLLHAQKLESLGVLSGGIAHDFNNLLHAVLGNLDLALMKYRGDVAVRQNIERAISAGKQAARLTDMILAYTGKKMYAVQKVNLTTLVEKNASMLSSLISRRVTFDLALDGSLPPILADEGQLQQVVMNLITNASEAIGDAAGTIWLATSVQEFDRSALNASRLEEKPTAGRYVVLEVRDDGCGMDSETLRRLFDPFFTTKFTGRGLGMSAVQGIIRAHQGAFLIESSPGAGTTIRVLFPMASMPQAVESITASPARDAVANRDRRPAQVLIVDDEEMVRQVVVAMLNELGVGTIAAADGEEALRIMRAQGDRIDLVLLDQNMPLLDGATVFREMKKVRPDIKVLLASGYSEAEISERFKGLGLAGFIQKPYDVQGLSDSLHRALRGGSI